jgi:hypothetical protein
MRNIKEVKADLDMLRAEYEAKRTILEEEITQIRDSRGYKMKVVDYGDYYEMGRSQEPGLR